MIQTKKDNQSKPVQLPYNGEPLRDGEVLVPQFISREYADLIEAQGVRTWYKAGIPHLVMFVPVPADRVKEALTAFNADVNDFVNEILGPNRYARCLITQPDGKQKSCPKEINGKYNPCANCPNRGKLPKENRNLLSLDDLEERQEPAGNMYATDSCAMLGSLLDNLMDDFTDKCPHYKEIIRLGYSGLSKKDIVQLLPVQKTQGYQIMKDCQKAVEEYLRN